MELEYSYEQKEKLAKRIQKIKKEKHFIDIQDIILKYNPDININTNQSGSFMYFQNLKIETYFALEKYLKKIRAEKLTSESNINIHTNDITMTETHKSETEMSDNHDDMYNFVNNPKLKYSIREKNIIKRKKYDKQINDQLEENHLDDKQFDKQAEKHQTDVTTPNTSSNIFLKKKDKKSGKSKSTDPDMFMTLT